MKKLTDLCEIQYGYAFDSAYFTDDESCLPLVRIRDVKRGFSETFYSGEYPEEYVLHAGDLLVGMDGEFNIARWKSREALLNQRVCRIIAKENADEEYLRFALSKALKVIENKTAFVTVKHLSAKALNELELNMPSYGEQKEISRILVKMENLIALYQEQLMQLDVLVKSRFVEMFGDLVSNPKGWKTYTFDEIFDVVSSKRILKSEWKSKGIPFLRVRDMVQLASTGTLDNEFFVSEEFYSGLTDSDGVPEAGDILISATSTLGKCHVVSEGERFYFKDADVLRFRAKKPINPLYFIQMMDSVYIKDQIAKTLGVTTVSHFTISAAKKIYMRYPNVGLQEQFATFVTQTTKLKLVG